MDEKKKTFFEEVGGMATIEKVHKIFYDKLYADSWIGSFFKEIDQKVIESQQNDFMGQNFGGKVYYLGKLPVAAHKHMFINEELFILRTNYLRESLIEAKVSAENIEKWLKIDGAFKNGILKKDISDCVKRYASDKIESYENPKNKKAA
jgi:hemoglobin